MGMWAGVRCHWRLLLLLLSSFGTKITSFLDVGIFSEIQDCAPKQIEVFIEHVNAAINKNNLDVFMGDIICQRNYKTPKNTPKNGVHF